MNMISKLQVVWGNGGASTDAFLCTQKPSTDAKCVH